MTSVNDIPGFWDSPLPESPPPPPPRDGPPAGQAPDSAPGAPLTQGRRPAARAALAGTPIAPPGAGGLGLPMAPPRRPARRVSRASIGVVLAVVLVGVSAAWFALRTDGHDPAMLALEFEKGNTYPFRVHMRANLVLEGGRGSYQLNTDITGTVTLKAVGVRENVVRLRGPLDPHSVVVNGEPLQNLQPIPLRIRMRPDGTIVCGGEVQVPSPEGPVFVGAFGFGPVLPEYEVEPGDTWGVQTKARCKGKKSTLALSGTLLRFEEDEGDGEQSVVQGTTEARAKRRGSGTLVSDETLWLDVLQGELVRAQGSAEVDVPGKVRGIPGGAITTGTLWYELSPIF